MRRQLSFPILPLLLGVTLAGCSAADGANGANAALFRGDPAHSGVYPGELAPEFGGVAWRVQTRGAVQGSPVIGGRLLYAGSTDGRLYAIERSSGDTRWTFDAGSPIASTPAVAEGLVIFAARDRRLRAIDAGSGRERWSVPFGGDLPWAWGHESGDFYLSSPNYAGGTVYVGAGDGNLYAIRARDGRVLWRAPTEGRVRSSPAIDGDLVFVGSADGRMYAFETATGRQRWRFDTEGVKLESRSFGYDRRTVQSSPAVKDSLVVFGGRDGFLYGVDRARGTQRWRVDHRISWVNTSPAVHDGLVFAGSSDGRFAHAVDARTGVERWRVTTPSLVWSSPAVSGDAVYVADWGGNLLALEARTGAAQWRHRMGGRMLSSPVLADGRIYIGSDDGGIYAYQTASAPLQRVVYWDTVMLAANSAAGHIRARDYLRDRDYRVLAADSLIAFLTARASDRAPSVVVFAIDAFPKAVASTASDGALLRRYLDAGGRVVWLGMPPLLWERNLTTGQADLLAIDRTGPARLLGVAHTRANFDPRPATITATGERWGLSGWWMMSWGADSAAVDDVLALDDDGLATAWSKRVGRGTFVRLPIGTRDEPPSMAQLLMLQVVAERR
ncbi:MAG TPA: PQQ-binding-like beta-propeller repeat protein [Gemmatimonadaceae bacterium]|nr:PQQ-binding-like beta-propeller repeat protein [Gemmatimonadaceae bacterium]